MSDVAAPAGSDRGGASQPNHLARLGAIWAVATATAVPLIIWVLGPHIPPSEFGSAARDQHGLHVLLTALAAPVVLMIWIYFGYAIAVFRQRGDAIADGPPLLGHARMQIAWVAVTSAIVLTLAVYGTLDLFASSAGGAGGGEGPSPLIKPPSGSHPLEVQVIGQQWFWSFRYPSYGGVETPTLYLPSNRWVELHVTSLDVAHAFWAIKLAVKADAVPGNDNVAYVKPQQTGSFQVRCAELCGLWHGHMNIGGMVVSGGAFANWIAQQRLAYAGVTKVLPPYSHSYFPKPLVRGG